MGLLDNFIRGTQVLGDLYSGDQTASMAGQPVPSGVGATAAGLMKGAGQFVGDVASTPKRLWKQVAGLDPNSSGFDDLQRIGVPRVPSAWLGSFTDTMADPLLATGALTRGASKLFASPAARSFMANESGSSDLDAISKFLGRAVTKDPFGGPKVSMKELDAYYDHLFKNAEVVQQYVPEAAKASKVPASVDIIKDPTGEGDPFYVRTLVNGIEHGREPAATMKAAQKLMARHTSELNDLMANTVKPGMSAEEITQAIRDAKNAESASSDMLGESYLGKDH